MTGKHPYGPRRIVGAVPTEVLYDVADHVATITLNAPERMNTISGAMLTALSAHLLEADADRDVRVVVLTGSGRAFCAGLDLQAQLSGPPGSFGQPRRGRLGRRRDRSAQRAADRAPPARHADDLRPERRGRRVRPRPGPRLRLRIAAESAKLNPGFAKRGILPESGGTWLLPRMLGYAKAAEVAFTGRTLVAKEALELGLVNRVVPDTELTRATAELAGEIAANAPLAVRAIKRMMRAAETETFEQNVHHVFLQLLPLLKTQDFQEGVAAFMEKRPARFTGR